MKQPPRDNDKTASRHSLKHKFIEDSLGKNEYVLYWGHLSWMPILLRIIMGIIVGGIIGGIVWALFDDFGLGFMILVVSICIAFISQIKQVIKNIGTDLAITNCAVWSKTGIIGVDTNHASYENISDAGETMPKWYNRVFHFGSVELHSKTGQDQASEPAFFDFVTVSRPRTFAAAVGEASNRYRDEQSKTQAQRVGDAVRGVGDFARQPTNGQSKIDSTSQKNGSNHKKTSTHNESGKKQQKTRR